MSSAIDSAIAFSKTGYQYEAQTKLEDAIKKFSNFSKVSKAKKLLSKWKKDKDLKKIYSVGKKFNKLKSKAQSTKSKSSKRKAILALIDFKKKYPETVYAKLVDDIITELKK